MTNWWGVRYYQKKADESIFEELQENNKCLVKMFCGTGKSKLMRYCSIAQNKKLVVYVVPSLSLLEQFYTDYLQDFPLVQRISCEQESTTDSTEIIEFLKRPADKIICITYQSFETLIHLLGDTKIDVCIFDEAHHVVGKTYKTLIFDSNVCEKQIFFTATPKKANSVIMYDKDNLDVGMCGKLVYDYSYFKGVMEGYLNPFEIRIDFYTENINTSVYEAMARAILASSNSRVLTFHADVNGDRDASVLRFVDETLFTTVFNKVLETEFPEKIGYYKNIQMIGLCAKINMKDRKRILTQFDETLDNEIFIISSCQTIGEGIDTKSANMCVFVDPKSSIVGITQNIGRIVRKIFGKDKPNSTILIPCWVDKEKYLGCDGDKDKCDEVIREDMNKEGNFNGILNVMSALKQEDEDLFDACLNYPSTYSPPIGDGLLVESLEHMLETYINFDEDETDEELLARVVEENNVAIEVHSNSLETPIEYYGQGDGKEVIRIFKTTDEETEDIMYQPIVKKYGTKRNTDCVEPLRRENRFNVKVHTNPDVKVLWNLKDGFDLSKDICSCIIDCEVVDIWPQRFEELKAFIVENERKPAQNSEDIYEKRLGQWLSSNQNKYRNNIQGMKDQIKYNLWTQFLEEYKEYFKSKHEIWFDKFENLKIFINNTNKKPLICSKNNEEKIIGQWFSQQQTNYYSKFKSMKHEERYKLWTQFLEDYKQYLLTNDEKWSQTFEELKIFINENKRKPIQKSKNVEEAQFGVWISQQQINYNKCQHCMKDKIRRSLWEQFLEEYKEYFVSNDEIWLQNFDELKTFMNEELKRPIQKSKLGLWLSNQTQNYKNKTDGMKNETRYNLWTQFLEVFKEHLFTDDEKWIQSFEKLKTFINENKRRPKTQINNKEEKYLDSWLSNQQHHYKKKTQCMRDEERYNIWTQFLEEYKEYFISNDEIWLQKFDELKIFMNENKRKPFKINIEEKQLTKWLEHQKTNYKNKTDGMKDEERYNLWTQFLEEYKKYFVNPLPKKEDPVEEEIEIIVKPKQKKTTKLTKINPEKKVETKQDIQIRTKPLITQFHNKFCKMRSDNLAQHFQQNPSDFTEYHRVRDECFQTFEPEDIPCERIIQELEKIKKGGKHVVDMGCGTAKIAHHFSNDNRFHITSYDHVAINDTVQVCDISHMPLEDGSVDMCIMSLALWGSNCDEYIREALRVLDENGILYIIDSTKRWSEEGTQDAGKLKLLLETNGFQIKAKDTKIDKWCYFKCMK
jgi:superfamily II DNA or RNA helicase